MGDMIENMIAQSKKIFTKTGFYEKA